ncbi:Gfo/Idh/MocA family protein [Crenobacter intestini]|uniref:Gfo/Idh/MocA family oxidoreductase n=1 Tax=Crenobacter intestini TaxID=2563443 RepID=A0A4T0V1A6_9NEIS|nr:Gfo/Idh/MocA family oxidoreductase [Crenobacter intestini]TIC85330.1 Gfo/Idh/MocA family oxidoreductase [Crenobacter intestini]
MTTLPIRVAVVGLGKMGLSHLAIINAHPDVRVCAICDASGYVLDVLGKYTGLKTYTNYQSMLAEVELDAVVIATPTSLHATMVRQALERGLHVFCEKPFCLDGDEGEALVQMAAQNGLVNQVGYHNRFVGAFQEVQRLLAQGVIGEVTHVKVEAYGPVVLKGKGGTWRAEHGKGGGCLYDYAAHPLNLLTWYLGTPQGVGGTILNPVFSEHVDDEVYSTLYYPDGVSAQLSVSWSDESFRKMSTSVTVLGKLGRIRADRQECQVFLRNNAVLPEGYTQGWNIRYTTDLTLPVWFYVRGEEYSAQIDYFVAKIKMQAAADNVNDFASALATDKVLAMLVADAAKGASTTSGAPVTAPKKKRFIFG